MNEKKEEFKSFAKMHPELINYVKNGEMSWQKFYEIYDIYGPNDSAWNSYFKTTENTVNNDAMGAITNKIRNINMNSIQEHIKTAQKALNLVSELTGKAESSIGNVTPPKVPRPINQFFED